MQLPWGTYTPAQGHMLNTIILALGKQKQTEMRNDPIISKVGKINCISSYIKFYRGVVIAIHLYIKTFTNVI